MQDVRYAYKPGKLSSSRRALWSFILASVIGDFVLIAAILYLHYVSGVDAHSTPDYVVTLTAFGVVLLIATTTYYLNRRHPSTDGPEWVTVIVVLSMILAASFGGVLHFSQDRLTAEFHNAPASNIGFPGDSLLLRKVCSDGAYLQGLISTPPGRVSFCLEPVQAKVFGDTFPARSVGVEVSTWPSEVEYKVKAGPGFRCADIPLVLEVPKGLAIQQPVEIIGRFCKIPVQRILVHAPTFSIVDEVIQSKRVAFWINPVDKRASFERYKDRGADDMNPWQLLLEALLAFAPAAFAIICRVAR